MKVAASCDRTITLRDGHIVEDARNIHAAPGTMILLRLISWPYFRRHVLRTLLTTAGIVLGVAVFVGMHTANQSVLLAFSHTVDRIAGKTELQVTAGETGFDESVLDKVQSASTVGVAVPVIEAVVDTRQLENGAQGNLLVLGIDMTGDRTLRDYELESGDDAVIDDPLVFLARPDSLIISKEFADRNRIASGGTLTLGTIEGDKPFTVRGIMKSSGLTSAFGGNLAIMDIYAAQKMFGRGQSFDRIDLAVKEGSTIADAERELRALLGPGFDVDPPSGRGQQFEAMLSAYSMMVGISSLFALFIGMFIIYNSFAIAVTQRRSEIGVLRALGATRRADPAAISARKRADRTDWLDWRAVVRHPDRAGHRSVDRRTDQRRLWRRAARRRTCDQSEPARAGARHRHRDQHCRGGDSGEKRCAS
jgi:putative ABC transport system permease protein